MSDNSRAIREAVENYFQDEGFKFSGFDEKGIAKTGFKIKSKLGHADIIFLAQEDRLQLRSMLPIKADEETLAPVAEFLLRANYGMRLGCFDFDFRDGEISFRVTIYCGEEMEAPTHEQIDHSVDICLAMVQRYGDGLLKVLYGMKTPEEAIEEIEG